MEKVESNNLLDAAMELQNTILQLGWKFCFIGGLAVLRWGQLRMTQDVDLCLLCGFGIEKNYISPLLKRFQSRISDAAAFAATNRILLLSASNGVPIDVTLSGLEFEKDMIYRASMFQFDDLHSLLTCSAEDLIVMKVFAGRAQDWLDVEGVISRQRKKLDRKVIIERLEPFNQLDDSPIDLAKLETIFARYLNPAK